MKNKLICGLSCVLGLGLAACTTSDEGETDAAYYPPVTYDAATIPTIDTAPAAIDTAPVYDPYVWVVVQDTEQKACATNGPGADIDAVLLSDATGPRGYGKIGTAHFTPNPLGNACENTDCSGSNCKYAYISNTFQADTLPPLTEGMPAAQVNETTSDSGYFSLNAGTLQIQIGSGDGTGPVMEVKSGDYISVYEVDQSYIATGAAFAGCICQPEHYTVSLQNAAGTKTLELVPSLLNNYNATCAPLDATSTDGCGSTVFMVP